MMNDRYNFAIRQEYKSKANKFDVTNDRWESKCGGKDQWISFFSKKNYVIKSRG